MDRPRLRFPFALACVFATFAFAFAVPAFAQGAAAPFDPSDVYFQAWLGIRDAEKLEKNGEFTAALEKILQSEAMFENVAKLYPEWKSRMVEGRLASTRETIAALKPKALAEQQERERKMADFEGGGLATPKTESAPVPDAILPSVAPDVSPETAPLQSPRAPADARRIAELERKLRDLQERARRGEAELSERLTEAQTELEAERAKLATAPARSEVDRLHRKVQELEGQREAMALALRQSRGERTAAEAKIATLEADIANARQKAAELERNLEKEREISNRVSRDLQDQLAELRRELKTKSGELATAQKTIADLRHELDETRAAFLELQDERDSLLREKEHMSALLNLNEAGRIQELIEQNMALAKDLREARERFDRVQADNDRTKEEYTLALRDLGIAKASILNLRKENRDQQRRLAMLEDRLREAEDALAAGAANPDEVEMLKNVIRSQLLQQTRQREARKELLAHAERMGLDHPELRHALEVLQGAELKLTPEEQKAIALEKVDGEFVSPVASRSRRERATTDLHETIRHYRSAAEKAFAAGRLRASEEVLRLILDEHPMHGSTLNSLGVVMLKQNEPAEAARYFRDALTMNGRNPFAHRMLGFSLYKMEEYSEAEVHLRQAVDLNPADAKAHVLLGNLAFRQDRGDEARNHFMAAISADPTLSEPHYNLAFLAVHQGRKQEGLDHYRKALENGAAPDPALEAEFSR